MATILLSSTIDQAETWRHFLSEPLQQHGAALALRPPANRPDVAGALPTVQKRNGSPALLLLPLADLLTFSSAWKGEPFEQPLLFVGRDGNWFQLGPAFRNSSAFCPACLKQQFTHFPGATPALPGENGRLPDEQVKRLAQQIAAEIVAFSRCLDRGLLERGYWLRFAVNSDRRQEYRRLRNPFCEICSIYARYPSEAIYVVEGTD